MRKLIFFILFYCFPAFALTPISGGKYFAATNPTNGWLQNVVVEARVDSATQAPVWMAKWSVLYADGTSEFYCKRINLSDQSAWNMFAGKGPVSLGYVFVIWQMVPNSNDPWCTQ